MSQATDVEIEKKKRGRPKTINVDKKEYQKKYYEAHKDKVKERYNDNPEVFKERTKQYMEKLKETDNERYKALRDMQSKGGNSLIKRQFELCKLIKELLDSGSLTIPDTHRERVLELLN